MRQYIAVKMEEHHVDIACPGSCGHMMSADEMGRILDEEQMEKYTRLVAKQQNPHIRECPTCKTLVAGYPDTPVMRCTSPKCMQEFCFYHGMCVYNFFILLVNVNQL